MELLLLLFGLDHISFDMDYSSGTDDSLHAICNSDCYGFLDDVDYVYYSSPRSVAADRIAKVIETDVLIQDPKDRKNLLNLSEEQLNFKT